ncbi:MAG: hypothetical protein IJX53_00505 [Clostridia bacterium]|nr:hypothetical protein [Clostridia bacterium]
MFKTGTVTFKEVDPYAVARNYMNAATRARYSLYKLNDRSDEYWALQAAFDRYIAASARRMADLADAEAEAME